MKKYTEKACQMAKKALQTLRLKAERYRRALRARFYKKRDLKGKYRRIRPGDPKPKEYPISFGSPGSEDTMDSTQMETIETAASNTGFSEIDESCLRQKSKLLTP